MKAAISPRGTGVAAASRLRLVFDLSFLQAPVADGDPVRNADQLEISKHHARTLAAIVEQHFDAGRLELVVQRIGRRPHSLAAVVAHRRDRHGERGQRLRPRDAPAVVVLLDGSGDDARDPDPVAAHFHDLRLTVGVEISCTHRPRVHVAQREDMAHLDAAQDFEPAAAIGRRVAGNDVAQIGDAVGFTAIAAEIDAAKVEIGLVRAADEVRHRGDRPVDDQRQVLRYADGTEVAGVAAGDRDDFRLAGPAEFLEPRNLGHLDFVQRVVAADQQHVDARGLPFDLGREHDALDGARERQHEELRDFLARRHARCRHLLHRLGRARGATARARPPRRARRSPRNPTRGTTRWRPRPSRRAPGTRATRCRRSGRCRPRRRGR